MLILAVGSSLTVACSTVVTGEAVPSEIPIDTGNFPTSPREIDRRIGVDAAVQGSYVLADFLVAPADVDSRFDTAGFSPLGVFPERSTVESALGANLARVMGGVVGGANATGKQTPVEFTAAPAPQMNALMLRYASTESARSVFAQMKEQFPPVGTPGSALRGYADAFEGASPETIGGNPMWWLQRNEYIIGSGFLNIASRPEAERLAARFFDMQVPRLSEVSSTPEKSRTGPFDKDGIMRLTRQDAGINGVSYRTGWLTPRAYAVVTDGSWKYKIDLFERSRAELVGKSGNTIVRTRDPEGARTFLRLMLTTGATGPQVSIKGVPDSGCSTDTTTATGITRVAYNCVVAVGRYVAINQGSSMTEAQQGGAASYETLRRAN